MSKTKSPVEQLVDETRNELLANVLIPCKTKGEPFHFSPRGMRVATVAKAIGITDPTLRAFAEGKVVSMGTLSKIRGYLDARQEQGEPENA
jgi:hypothetical protein